MKKRRIRRILMLLAVLAVATPLVLAGVAQWLISSRLTPESLVAEIERGRNCRALVESCSVRLLSFPATAEVRGLRILPADGQSRSGKPLRERKPPKENDTGIAVPSATLEVNLWALLTGKLAVRNLTIESPEVKMVRKKGGVNTLARMMGPPPKEDDEDGAGGKRDVAADGKPEDKSGPSLLYRLSAALESATLRGGTVVIRNEKRKQLIRFEGIAAAVNGVTIPALAGGDGGDAARGSAELATRLIMDDYESGRRQFDFPIAVTGNDIGFDPHSGLPADNSAVTLTVARDAYIDRIPTLEKLARKFAKLKDRIGLDLTSMPVNGTLQQDTTLTMAVSDRTLRFRDDTNFPFDTYRIRIRKDGWIRLTDGMHAFDGLFTANDDITKDAVAGIDEFLSSKDEALARIARETIVECLLNDKGRLALPYKSTDEIGSPEVDLSRSFEKKLAGAFLDAGKHLLLDGLSGGDGIKGLLKAIDPD